MNFFIKIAEVAKINIKSILSYVSAAWGALVVTILQIFVFYYIWMAIYGGKPLLNGINKEQMITYIIFSRVMYTQITWGYISTIGQKIHTGEIAMDLLRPIDFQTFMCASRLGDFIGFGAMTALPAVLISAVFLGIYLPHTPLTYLYFILSLFMSIIISFFVEFFLGLITFYTAYSWGLETLHEALVSFLSGALVPLEFFPAWLKSIVNVLPFKDMMYTPISIYLGLVKGSQIWESLLFQFFWIVLLFLLSRLFFLFSIRKVTVQGG